MKRLQLKPDPLGRERDPFRVFLLGWLAVSGVALACGYRISATLTAQLVSTSERLYGVLLAVSSLMVLAGMFWPWDPRDGLISKGAGFIGLGSATFVFALATLITWTTGGVFVGVSGIIFAAICFRSCWQAFHRLRTGIPTKAP